MKELEQSSIDILKLLTQNPSASAITSLLLVLSFVWTTGMSIKKNLSKKHEDSHIIILERLATIEMELLKVQLLTGIDQNRLTISETMHFLERYTSLGGNSFVSYKAEKYIRELEEKENELH